MTEKLTGFNIFYNVSKLGLYSKSDQLLDQTLLHNRTFIIKLMKGKAPGKHSLHEKTAGSVLLKLFISSNEWCHTTDASPPSA